MKAGQRKERYKKFIAISKAPVFFRAWWLDAVAGAGNWDAVFAGKGENLSAVMPYVIHKKGAFTFLGHPPLTPYLGPWLLYPAGQKADTRAGFEIQSIEMLSRALPRHHKALFSLFPKTENGLGWHWTGYTLTPRYTYVLPQPENDAEDMLWAGYKGDVRRQINKARKNIVTEYGADITPLYSLLHSTFKRKQKSMPVSQGMLTTLWEQIRKNDAGYLLYARHVDHGIISGMMVVEDDYYSYYLVGGNHARYLTHGAAPLLMHRALLNSFNKQLDFNFEGSMYPDIARFFRSFGAYAQPYLQIRKTSSFILKLIQCMKWKG